MAQGQYIAEKRYIKSALSPPKERGKGRRTRLKINLKEIVMVYDEDSFLSFIDDEEETEEPEKSEESEESEQDW